MDLNDSFLGNNSDQFYLTDLLSPSDYGINISSTTEQSNDQLSEVIESLGFDLNSQGDDGALATDDSSIFDAITLDSDFINQIFYDNGSPSTSDSGNYSPTCSTSDDQSASDNDRIINIAQATQSHQSETKFTVVPNTSNLVPVHIPIHQIVTNGKSTPGHPMICIMPITTHARSLNSQQAVNQGKQRILSPKHGPSSAPTFTSVHVKNVRATVFTPVNNLFNTLPSGVARYLGPQRSTKVGVHFSDYDRKKEDRKIRNRYSAQLSRIRKKNEVDKMKRNLASKDVLIEKLKNEIEILRGTIETLRKENEMLKSSASNRNSNGLLGLLGGAVCLFGFVSNVDPIRDTTSLVALNLAKSKLYSVQNRVNTGRMLFSLDYHGDGESRENSHSIKKTSDPSSHSNLNYSVNCDGIQKKYLNQTEAMKLNNDVFAWINRHECLQFMHIRRIFRVPISKELATSNVTIKSMRTVERGKIGRENRQQRTAIDKMEAARLKAVRERAWRHIDMISSNVDNAAIKSQVKTMDYDVMGPEHIITNWLKDKTDALTVLDMESQYAELARNLKQREDTLYVVAMKNYYLLPATDRNGSMQPRMALILPALSFNGTLPNQVAMMRLECDITGTGLFHLPSSLLPLFYDHSVR
uniref:BZIP domain-containing protein n=1 Tax=Elaeophora elaphi TaxID=1147741 RepID=A0A0R3S2P6_9BILA